MGVGRGFRVHREARLVSSCGVHDGCIRCLSVLEIGWWHWWGLSELNPQNEASPQVREREARRDKRKRRRRHSLRGSLTDGRFSTSGNRCCRNIRQSGNFGE